MLNKMEYDYNERVATLSDDDFFTQVRRTSNGQNISQEQFALIIESIEKNLQLNKNDILLDLCCGNGHLGSHFPNISNYVGVDNSINLIRVAEKYFTNSNRIFILDNIFDYLKNEKEPTRFTKILLYSSIQYFTPETILLVLTCLYTRFINASRIHIGPVPDRNKADLFFAGREPRDIFDNTSSLGKFYSPDELEQIASKTGYHFTYVPLNDKSHQAHYRYDIVLSRNKE